MKKTKGFTIVELLAVIVILGLLVAIGIPIYLNITKTVKNTEYESKKKYIEGIAANYAEEHNITSSLFFTPSRLIANGYMSADKYVVNDGEEIPFIINPNNDSDNLACHIINLSIDNYEYTAEMTEQSDCALSSEEVVAVNMGIEAYRLNGNTIGNKIGIDGKTFDWVNSDVVLVINPKYNNDDIIISANGKTSSVEKSNMLTNPYNGMNLDSNYSNTVVIRAEKILKNEVSINIKTGDEIKIATVIVRIDKESAVVNTEKFDGWVGVEKSTLVYLSDGSGSGPAGVYVTKENSFNSNNYFEIKKDGTNTTEISALKGIPGYENGLINGPIYLWPMDKAGNISNTSFLVIIKNVDLNSPEIEKIEWKIDSDVSDPVSGKQGEEYRKNGIDKEIEYDRLRVAVVTIKDNESGIHTVQYCLTSGESCNPDIIVESLNSDYMFKWGDAREAQRICYNAVDNVGNRTTTECTDSYLVDGTNATLENFEYDEIRTIHFLLKDDESGVYKYHVSAKRKDDKGPTKTCEGRLDDYYSQDNKECLFKYLTAAKYYDVTISFYNRSNILSEVIKDFYTDYRTLTGHILCNSEKKGSTYWCTGDDAQNGVFIKYGDYKFVIYKRNSKSVYALGSDGEMYCSLINQTCCDHSKCTLNNVTLGSDGKNTASGIWGTDSIKYHANTTLYNYWTKLPNNRASVTNKENFIINYIKKADYKAPVYEETKRQLSFVASDIRDYIANGYTYEFPSKYVSGATCYYTINGNDTKISGGKLTAKVGTGKTFQDGKYYTFTCKKSRSSSVIESLANNEYYNQYQKAYDPKDEEAKKAYSSIKSSIPRYDYISKSVLAKAVDDIDGDNDYSYITPSLSVVNVSDTLSTTNSDKSTTANYGLLTYNDYATIKQYPYFQRINGGQGIDTLLLTVIKAIVYSKKDFKEYWNRAYGHDDVYSKISALYATKSGYYATTPMKYGRNKAAMVLPLKYDVDFVDGTGEENDPFILSEKYGNVINN